ncbi:MAG: YcjF family protein [Firmicutes bacterium]|nr:YcjF family protein [Bacillota bacterium]
MQKRDTTKYFWYAIAIGFTLLFILMLLSSVLDVGDRLRAIHPYVEYGFYVLSFLLVYFLIIRPVHIILFSPAFSVETTLDQPSRKNAMVYRKVAKRILTDKDLPEGEVVRLQDALNSNSEDLKLALTHVFSHHTRKKMNQVIKRNAKTVMISTAISQNGRLDFFTVVVVNIKMIKELVVMCGFRPSYKNLSKLTVNVFTTALIAEGLENLDINDVLPTSTLNTLGDIPFIRPMLSSVTQGISNALLTLRIGIVTRKYLFSDSNEISKEKIRHGALLEAAGMLPSVLAEAFMILPRKIANLFKKPQPKETEPVEDKTEE